MAAQGLDLNASWFHQKKNKLGLTPEINWGGDNEFQGYYLDLLYKKPLGKGEFQARLRFDDVDRDLEIGHFPADAVLGRDADTTAVSDSQMLGTELQYSVPIGDKINVITGLVYEDSSADPYLFIFNTDGVVSPFSAFLDSYDTQDLSLYAQGFFKPNERLTLIAGARYNDNSDAEDTKVVPRMGAVFKLGKDAYLKLLYGEAYRNPDFFEKHVATNGVLWGDPNLGRELIATFDLGLDIHFKERYALRVNAFQLDTEDLISRRGAINNPNGAEYYNSEGEEVQGLELELKGVWKGSKLSWPLPIKMARVKRPARI